MNLTSASFFVFLAATILLFHVSKSVPYRRFVLGTANLVFIASYLNSFTEALPLLAFLVLGYLCVYLVHQQRSGVALVVSVASILVAYLFLKRFSFFEPLGRLPFSYLLIGLSYVLFRILHVVVDIRSSDLTEPMNPLAFFRYTCNFLCFVSGPIQRYQDFSEMDGIEQEPLDASKVYEAFSRVATGYVKFVIVAGTAEYAFSYLNQQLLLTNPSVAKLFLIYATASSLYTVFLYFNFSGYMDIVIGAGRLLGQSLPENFDKPFVARSFLEFWQRWHMTLSQWFKFYLFNPLLMALMSWFPAPGWTAFLGVVAFFITFLVMGIWHGTTAVFVIYGLLMGTGASINKLWQIFCADRLGKKRYRVLSENTAYIYFARGLTVAYFVIALTCLWTPEPSQFMALIGRLSFAGMAGAFIMVATLFALAALALDAVSTRIAVWTTFATLQRKAVVGNLALAGKMMAVVAVLSLFHKAPDFVYKAF
jgi:D-alanyl-lipoteichoic acid acyltransferase DltB (MBOAT superfamily)